MSYNKQFTFILLGFFTIPLSVFGQVIDVEKLQKIPPRNYYAKGLIWNGESALHSNWNKICKTPDGKIWFSGGDHWGTDRVTGPFEKEDRYERPWGFGNTSVCYYDPQRDKVFEEFKLGRSSALYSNAETPGHGKIHANIASDSKGNIYTAGYMGSSYNHEYTRAFYPKSYSGGAIIRYNTITEHIDYFGIPCPNSGIVAVYYDEERNIVNGLTVDRAKFWRVNLTTMELNRYESVTRQTLVPAGIREMIMDKEGACYFANDFGGLTRFDSDSEKFTDIDIKIPGKYRNFRASVVSTNNTIYAITTDGFLWSYSPNTGKFEDFGHVIGVPEQHQYTPNIAIDEEWNRLYFISGNHGRAYKGFYGILTIFDLNEKKYYWMGYVEGIDGCFGALTTENHTVYFSCFGNVFEGNEMVRDKNGSPFKRPYLLRYDPPKEPGLGK